MYLYIVSSGEHSDYELEFFALHEQQFTEEEMEQILNETKVNYISKGYRTDDYCVENLKLEEEFKSALRSKGFKIVYPVGEFHLLNYDKLGDLKASVPWNVKDREPSALRIGL